MNKYVSQYLIVKQFMEELPINGGEKTHSNKNL